MNEYYENGPEGMPRVERMTDSTIMAVLSQKNVPTIYVHSEQDYTSLRLFAHAIAEETLARVPAWPAGRTTSPVSQTTDTPTPMAYVATDLDGRYDVGTTPGQAKQRAGHGCDTVFPLYDIGTAAPAAPGQSLALRAFNGDVAAAAQILTAQPQPVAEQIKLMTMQEVIDAMHSNNLLTDIGYNALLNGDSLNATLEYITQVINFVAIPTIHAARVAIQQPQGKPNADCSGDPKSCPDNEGYGCACDPMNTGSKKP